MRGSVWSLRSTRSGQKKVQGWRKGAGSKIAVGPPIPIYIASDRIPSQHVGVGLAQARPKNRVVVGSTWNFQESLSLAYFIPQNGKEVFLAKEKYFSLWQALYFELFRNHSVWKKYTVGKRIVLSFLWKKTIGPRIPSFSRKNQTKVVRKAEDDVP